MVLETESETERARQKQRQSQGQSSRVSVIPGAAVCLYLSQVVAFNPRWGLDPVTKKKKRLIDVHVWFAIGSTTSKYKEADSHFHNAVLVKIIDYYKEHLPLLTGGSALVRVLMLTDGCKGQYKGRFNFKRVAEYASKKGVAVIHAFVATRVLARPAKPSVSISAHEKARFHSRALADFQIRTNRPNPSRHGRVRLRRVTDTHTCRRRRRTSKASMTRSAR